VARFESVLDQVKALTVLRVPRRGGGAGAELWAQLELALPGGMKDRVALSMLEAAEAAGQIRPGKSVIVESSSGTLAEGLARIATLKGYRLVIVTDPRIDEMSRAKLEALGAELDVVEDYDPVGGWQSARLRRLREVIDGIPYAYWTCQYDSPANRDAYRAIGSELVGELGDGIAAIVGGVGTGGSLCGVAASLKPFIPDLRVVAVDAVGSVLFHQPDRRRLQGGHSNSVVPGNIDYSLIDEVHWLADGEAFNGCRELARRAAVFGGGSTGATWIAASWVARRYGPDRRVVAIFPDRGDRYCSTIYSDSFLEGHGIREQVAEEEPVPIRYGVDVAERWSWAELPHDGSAPYVAGDVRTTREIARSLGLVPAGVDL
jgi:cysteine synthase A